ncbi:MAG: sce7726 family protein [Pseudobutyrivibrio ruminis]|uniref:sce7726 family protein n=1 Tax=Pseudobutyrivibrio ruminis TaxID=46206 RepID=UPI0026F31E8A|nr:sce7726 family protein [Pseudobutyrivibrio ruminis]MBE5912800.1 sce7726 family protein [Pseudobutyrivibrio ruminis]
MLKDKDIREPLFEFLEESYGKTRIIEEKMMGKSRADVIMIITDALVGIEIKSDADTYTRLEGQIKDYDKYFDYNIVVVGSSHAMHVEEHVPDYWGIITVDEVDEKPDFYFLRKPEYNKKVKLNRKLELLWRPELGILLQRLGMPEYKSLSKPAVRKKIIESKKVDPADVSHEISELLFERDYEKLLAEIAAFRKAHSPKRRGPKKRTSIKRTRRAGK